MKPLFQVGDEVVLQSKYHPELNGGCTVTEVKFGRFFNRDFGKIIYGYSYRTTIPTPPGARWWKESSLRKKHRPSDQSFDELIREINGMVKS